MIFLYYESVFQPLENKSQLAMFSVVHFYYVPVLNDNHWYWTGFIFFLSIWILCFKYIIYYFLFLETIPYLPKLVNSGMEDPLGEYHLHF